MRLLIPALLLVAATASTASTASAGEKFNRRVAILDDFPREVSRGSEIVISGKRVGAYKTPELIVIAPNGRTYRIVKGTFGEYTFAFEVEFENGVGIYRMELMLRTHKRYQSAARFNVWYGKRKPKAYEDPPLPEGPPTPISIHTRLVEKRVQRHVNALRKQIKLKPVGWNEAVAARARDHASKMARVERRVHKFGNTGVNEMLTRSGAGKWAPESGPDEGWPNVTTLRPFSPPQIRSTNDNPRNHVVHFVLAASSLDVMWEQYFVREAAFRLLAADPHCLEVGIGCARSKKGNKQLVYYCICFVQVNDKTVKSRQDRAYDKMLRDTTGDDPKLVRRLALWGRAKTGLPRMKKWLKSARADIAGAALDGLLVLDEEEARKIAAKLDATAVEAERTGRLGAAYGFFAAMGQSYYDWEWRNRGKERSKAIRAAARAEFDQIEMVSDPDEKKKQLKAFTRRCQGIPLE
ncbi:MAG: CAP domain-containing protein [Planctomycetota bacterium]|jgi:hypothetical protein